MQKAIHLRRQNNKTRHASETIFFSSTMEKSLRNMQQVSITLHHPSIMRLSQASATFMSPLSLLSSCIPAVISPRISAMGFDVDKIPGLNGCTMLRSARVVTQVCRIGLVFVRQGGGKWCKTYLNSTNLMLDKVDDEPIRDFTATLLHAL